MPRFEFWASAFYSIYGFLERIQAFLNMGVYSIKKPIDRVSGIVRFDEYE